MRAVTWVGKKKMEVQRVADPTILNPRECVVKITSTALVFVCGCLSTGIPRPSS